MHAISTLAAHWWTIWPSVRWRIAPPPEPPSVPWTTTVADGVTLSGRWSDVEGSRVTAVVVHGLGGSSARGYAIRAATAAVAAGMSCLRINLRGVDGACGEFYHAGLTEDLDAVLQAPELAGADAVVLFGFSLGGHLVLRYATEPGTGVCAVAAVCAPLDLDACVDVLDRAAFGLYRRYLLLALRRQLRGCARHRRPPLPLERAAQIRTIREWDDRVVAPRYGFADADDYYRRMSVGRRLDRLEVPALLVASTRDPMVPVATIRRRLQTPPPFFDVRLTDAGGHVGFPADLDLGLPGASGIDAQVVGWLAEQATGPGSTAARDRR